MLGGFALMRAGRSVFPERMARQMRQRLLSMLVINVLISFIPQVDKYAHFGGGLAGFLLVVSGLLAPRTIGAVDDEPPWIRVLAPVTAVLLALSLMVALVKGRPWAPADDALVVVTSADQ